MVPEVSDLQDNTTRAPVAGSGANLQGGGGDILQAVSSSHNDVGTEEGATAGVTAITL